MEDYNSMKRKELQALCKKHNIPANSSNSLLALQLSQLLNNQEKQKPTTRQRTCLRSPVETADEGEAEVSKREAKKVRFSPTNDLVEYELRSGKKQQDVVRETRARRKSVAKKVEKPDVDIDSSVELIDDGVQIPVKLTRSVKDVEKGKDVNEEPEGKITRSKVHGLGKRGVVQPDENKQNKRPVKGVEKASESVVQPVVARARVTRSKAQTLMEDDMGLDVNPQVKKKSGRQVAKVVQVALSSKEIMDIPVRATRSRGQTLKEDTGNAVTKPIAEKKRTRREMKATDQSSNSSNVALEDNQELPKRKSLRTREVKAEDEDEGDKVEVVDNRRVTRSKVVLPVKSTGRSSKSKTENKVEVQRKSKRVQQLEETLEHAVKNVNRRESAMQPVKTKVVLHLEEPVNGAGRVTRRKSLLQKAQGKGIDPEETEVVLHLEEPVNGPVGRVTRRKSIMQKAQRKGIDKPLVEKSDLVKETEIPKSPKTVGKRQSKKQSGNLSMIDEGLEDKEDLIGSGKDASEDNLKAVANSTVSPKSRKHRGTPIIEDGPIETEYASPLDESSRRSTRSASKSEGKAVTYPLQSSAKKQLESGLKTCESSGAIVRDGSSKKRGKLSGMKQSESEDHTEKSSTEGTPVSKLVTFELDEKVIETERTPAIDGSHRRFTRSAIGSDRKEPRQSAIKEQLIVDVQHSSHKVAKFRHGSAVNTAPGRVTRSGIKRGGNVAGSFSERVDKKKQQSESAHQKKPFDDLHMSSHKVAEARLNPDVTIGAQSEIPKEVTDQILELAGDFSASASARSPAEIVEESRSGTAIIMESLSSLFEEKAFGAKSHANFEVETPPRTNSNIKTSSEAAPDGSNVQNQEGYVNSAIFNEAEAQVALNSEKSVLKSGRPEAYEKEMELANLGSMSKRPQSDVRVEEPMVSVCMSVEMEETVDLFGDADNKCDSISFSQAFEQSDIKCKSEDTEDLENPSIIEHGGAYAQKEKGFEQGALTCKDSLLSSSVDEHEATDNGEHAEEGERGSAQKQVMEEPVSEDNNVHGSIEKLQSPDMANREVSDGELDGETNKDDTVVQSTAGDELEGLAVDEIFTEDDIVTAHDSLAKQSELSTGKDISFGLDMDRHGVANDLVDTGKEPTQGLEFEAVPSTGIDVCEIPILGESDGVGGIVNATKECETDSMPSTAGNMPSDGEDHVLSGVDGEEEADNTNNEHESNPKPLTDDDVSDTSILGKDDEYNVTRLFEPITDPSSANDICETPLSGKDNSFGLATDRRGVEDNLVDAGKEPAPELELEVAPSTANDVREMPNLGKSDCVDGGVNATKECETDSMPSTAGNTASDGADLVLSGEDGEDDADNTNKEHEPNPKPLTNDGVSDTSVLGKDDYDNITRLFEPTLDPSSANDIVETPISGDDICSDIAMDRTGVADAGKELAQEHEFEVVPSASNDVQEMSSLGESVGVDGSANATKECETDSVPSTAGNMPSDGEDLVLSGEDGEDQAHNTNKEHESNLKRSTDDDVSDTSILGKDDDYNITRLYEPTSDPSTNDIVETPFSVDDIFGESSNAIYDLKSPLKPITDNDDVENGVNNGPKELESGLEPSVANYSPNVPVSVNNADKSGQDGESEHEQLTSIDTSAMGEQYVGGVGSEPAQNENMPVVTDFLIRSPMAVDAREESIQDIDNDAVSDYFGDIYGLGNAMGVSDTENDNWNEQKVIRTSEPDESAFLKGSDSISPDMNIEQITEETEPPSESDHASSDKKEQPVATIDHDLDSGKSMEDRSNHAVDMLDSRLVGYIKVQETPTREEIPVGDTLSDAPTSLKEDNRHKQEETQKANTSMDWGNYSFRMDGFQKSVSANENDDLLAKSTKGGFYDRVSDLQSSARSSSSIQESSSLAVDFVNSVKKLEHSSRNVADRESDQDVGLLKENADMIEENFNWPDSPLKSLFTLPSASRISHVKEGREHAVGFATSAHDFDHQGENESSGVFNGDNTQGNATDHENEMCGVSNFEHFSNKYFEDEEVDGSIDWSGKNKRFEFKGDQYDLSSEAARTGHHHEASGLNYNSIRSGVFEEKETQPKGSEMDDDLAFDKGT